MSNPFFELIACKTCHYSIFQLMPGQMARTLHCSRYPPQIIVAGTNIMSMIPPVMPDARCGEFIEATDKKEPPTKKEPLKIVT